MSTILYLDAFSGVSGDMLLGALLDAGLPLDALRAALGSLAIEDYTLERRRVLRAGVSATKFELHEVRPGGTPAPGHAHGDDHAHTHTHTHSHSHAHGEDHAHDHAHAHDHGHQHAHAPEPGRGEGQVHDHAHTHTHQHAHRHEHGPEDAHAPDSGHHGDPGHADPHARAVAHDHGHGHHAHRTLQDIEARIARSALAPASRDRAVALFRRLAEAEAAVHDMPVDRVHLHEVGALDSIIDIVGGVFGLEWFGADRIVASPLNLGRGMVRCAHGTFPVPAPATARLVAGVPVYQDGPAMELTTPTGALLITGFAAEFGPMPVMRIERIGYGAGDRDLADRPNVFRVLLGATDAHPGAGRITVVEFELDDMNPQLYGVLMDRLLAAGASDVFYGAVQMKKNRPGTLVTVLCTPERRDALSRIVFRETTTLGVKYHEMARDCLAREHAVVATPWGAVAVKVGRLDGAVVNATPEFDDCVRVAQAAGVPVKDVQSAALKAWLERPAAG